MTAEQHPVTVRRDELGLSREELAEKASVVVGTIERLEAGLTRMPQEATLGRIAQALGLEPNRLERQIVAHRGRVTA